MNKEAIEQYLDGNEISYLKNKNKGGGNNRKGAGYEDCFMVYKILDLFSENAHALDEVSVYEQVFCYVDDLKIVTPLAVNYFQLKNSDAVYWGQGGNRSLTSDFIKQFNLSQCLGEQQPITTLVVSCESRERNLKNNIPKEIAKHSNVCFFPNTNGSLNKLVIGDYGGIKQLLKTITMVSNPSDEVLEGTFASLLIAKRSSAEVTTLGDVFRKASSLYPTQVRPYPFEQDWARFLSTEFTEILDAIPGLVYGAERGVFHWNGYGTSGVFGYAVVSDEFKRFQELIINNPPHDFEKFEEALP